MCLGEKKQRNTVSWKWMESEYKVWFKFRKYLLQNNILKLRFGDFKLWNVDHAHEGMPNSLQQSSLGYFLHFPIRGFLKTYGSVCGRIIAEI